MSPNERSMKQRRQKEKENNHQETKTENLHTVNRNYKHPGHVKDHQFLTYYCGLVVAYRETAAARVI